MIKMNKYQEAFKRIKNVVVFNKNYNEYKNDLEYVQELVDKETGQKKHIENCKDREYLNHNYCYACGQKLDWSEIE